jgi:23S rRNA (adenine2030-N6)-methyltransferase
MLSYQHLYHAGNLADVHKHALLCAMLGYLTRKDKPLSYLETHSGRGLYDLSAAEAVKTGEAAQGVQRVDLVGWLGADHPYVQRLAAVRAQFGAASYPGSPLLAAGFMRDGDRMDLAELHPREFTALETAMAGSGARLHRQDGLQMAQALCPPTPRRGLLLIDPSYEVKDEYALWAKAVPQLHRKWNVGVIALWYPLLVDGRHKPMVARLRDALPEALVHEIRFPPVRESHRMVGSGMVIVNPPWGIEDETRRLSAGFATLAP